MKSVLISSDFVNDNNGNLRLLEINTNTNIGFPQFEHFDFTELKQFLLDNEYNKVVFVYNNNLNLFSEFFKEQFDNDESVNSIEVQLVKVINTFYGIPADVVDNETTFIIRSVYDSTAIVDSKYCTNEINLFDLFVDNNDTGSIPNLMYKRDDGSKFDSLNRNLVNASNIPDYYLKKAVFSPFVNNKLVKLDNGNTIDDFLSDNPNTLDTYIVENYYFNKTDSVYNNKIQSLRVYQLWFGSNLDAIDLAYVQSSALTEIPASSSFSYTNQYVDKKWKYSYNSNFLTIHNVIKQHGYRENSLVEMSDGSVKQLKDVKANELVKSYIITSLPDAAVNNYKWFEWKQTIEDYEALDKYETTASVIQIDKVKLDDFVVELTLDGGDKHYTLFGSGILGCQSGSNTVQFLSATTLSPGDKLITSMGTNILITDMNIVYDTGSYYSFYVEESDTLLLKPNSIIVHNYEC